MNWTMHKLTAGKDRTRFELHQTDVTVDGVEYRLSVRRNHTNDMGYNRERPFSLSIERKSDSRTDWSASGFKDAAQAKRVALAYIGIDSKACAHCVGGWRFERDGAGNLRDEPIPCNAC